MSVVVFYTRFIWSALFRNLDINIIQSHMYNTQVITNGWVCCANLAAVLVACFCIFVENDFDKNVNACARLCAKIPTLKGGHM